MPDAQAARRQGKRAESDAGSSSWDAQGKVGTVCIGCYDDADDGCVWSGEGGASKLKTPTTAGATQMLYATMSTKEPQLS